MDHEAPEIEQLRVDGINMCGEFSEAHRYAPEVMKAISITVDGESIRSPSSVSKAVTWTALHPIQTGPLANRRLVITLDEVPPVGSIVDIVFGAEAIQDLARNTPEDDFSLTFSWPEPGITVLHDSASPIPISGRCWEQAIRRSIQSEVTTMSLFINRI